MSNYYSTTYTGEIIKLLSVFALILGFELPAETEVIVGSLLVLGGTLWTMYQRYQSGKEGRAGKVNVLGVRQ